MKHIVPTLIVAPDELSRAGLLGILAGARYRPIAGKGGWDAIVVSGKPLPAIVILILSGMMTEPAAVASQIETMAARSKVVVLADQCDAKLVRGAVCAGAAAYLPRSVSAGVLVQTLDLVLEGEVIFPASIARGVFTCGTVEPEQNRTNGPDRSAPTERISRLSSREIEILKRLVHGDSNKQISRQLDISETTVKVHVKAILRKVRVSNRTQAAIWGLDHLSNPFGVTASEPDAHIAVEAPLIPNAVPAVTAATPRDGYGRGVARL
ncbi:MAG: LuxR C-terminal-related transcriptional regulator [Variibacter sp.]